MKKFLPILFLLSVVLFFFLPLLSKGLLPIPADDIIGLYHPFRDLYQNEYPNGVPFKNYIITDPVRQQFPWRELSISLLKGFELPLWNPYTFSGTPLLANFQSAAFYPLNILFFILPFSFAWSVLVLLQPLLAGAFLYFYLNSLKLNKWASVFGGLVFAFCGFSAAWLEWNTVIHTGLWLPVLLLSIDKYFLHFYSQTSEKFNPSASLRARVQSAKLQFKIQNIWLLVFLFAMSSSFLAGHLQTFFYVFVITLLYLIARWWQHGRKIKILWLFAICYLLFAILVAIQLFPTLQFLGLSARALDQADWQKNPGWFVPFSHLVQFVAPDFFGNPATLNYWSIFNYGEFVGYIGIFPLIMAFIAIFSRRDKKTFFFSLLLLISLLFAFPTPLAKLPFQLSIPFLSTAQPTRLLFITDFSLALLAAFGLDFFLKKKKAVLTPLIFLGVIFLSLWTFVLKGVEMNFNPVDIDTVKRNLYLPTMLFAASLVFVFLLSLNKRKHLEKVLLAALLIITAFDLVRFGIKYNPFVPSQYVFPQTKTIAFLQKQQQPFRIMASDSQVFPPNFSTVYRLQSVDGYDPLYLRRYAELIAATERNKPDISTPFGFNRIIIPHNIDSKIANLLGVKYFLSITERQSPKLTKVFEEGKTIIYENKEVLPRVFFVEKTKCLEDKTAVIQHMFRQETDLQTEAFIEGDCHTLATDWSKGTAKITMYAENNAIIETENEKEGFLVFLDSYYPTWHATVQVDGRQEKSETPIYITDLTFRGIVVPAGKHTIEFFITLL